MTNKFIDAPRAFSWSVCYDQAFINNDSEKVIYTVDNFIFLTDLENHEINRACLENHELVDIVKKEFADSLNDLDRDPEKWEHAMLTIDVAWV